MAATQNYSGLFHSDISFANAPEKILKLSSNILIFEGETGKKNILTIPILVICYLEFISAYQVIRLFNLAYDFTKRLIIRFQEILKNLLDYLTNNKPRGNIEKESESLTDICKNVSRKFEQTELNYLKLFSKLLYEYIKNETNAGIPKKTLVAFLGIPILVLSALLETAKLVINVTRSLVYMASFAPFLATSALFYGPIYLANKCGDKSPRAGDYEELKYTQLPDSDTQASSTPKI